MPLYRFIKPVNHKGKRIEAGTVRIIHFERAIARAMEEREIIARAATPPLYVLDGWQDVARKAELHGMITVEDLLEALDNSTSTVSQLFGITEAVAAQWQDELLALVSPPRPDN